MLMLVVALLCLAGSVYLVAEYVSLPARERMLSFRRAAAYGKRSQKKDGALHGSLRERALVPAMERAARAVLRINPKMSVEAVNLRLLSAGLGRRVSPTAFLAGKMFAAIAGLVLGFVFVGTSKGVPMGIAMGAAFGALDTMLSKIADFYEEEVDTAVAGLMKLLEPILIAFLGVAIGGIVIAMYLPMFTLIGQIG